MAKQLEAHVYFPADVGRKLKEMTKRNRRSLSAEIVIAVEERIEKESKKKRTGMADR